MTKYVYDFAEGNKDQKDLLGGKGANLAEMTNLGLPVPPGFTITTEACRAYLEHGQRAGRPRRRGRASTSRRSRRRWAARSASPTTRCWCRCAPGAKFSMPGMMETVLNVGLNDESVHGPGRRRAATSASPATPTAGCCRCSAPPCSASTASVFADELDAAQGATAGTDARPRPRRRRPARAGRDVQAAHRGAHRPRRSRRTRASSWTSRSAPSSTRGTPSARCSTAARSGSPSDLGTAVNIRRWSSATAATTPAPASRSPATRRRARRACTATTCRTRRARTSSPASATPCRWPTSSEIDKASYDELLDIMATLEQHYRDLCDIEFTIERGKLWMLQTRVGKRTAGGGVPDRLPAGRRGPDRPGRGAAPGHRRPARAADVPALRRRAPSATLLAKGMNASPGAAVGKAVFDSDDRRRVGRARRGRDPGPQGDQPRRPARHGRRPRHPDQPRRQDLARRGGGPRHGPHLRVRRRGARRRRRRRRRFTVRDGADGRARAT